MKVYYSFKNYYKLKPIKTFLGSKWISNRNKGVNKISNKQYNNCYDY